MNDVSRRQMLGWLTATGAAGLAGCLGDDDDDEEHGERVPTVVANYWTAQGFFTTYWERAAPIVEDNIEELGVEVDITSTDYATAAAALVSDEREMNITLGGLTSDPVRLDPEIMSRWMVIDWAGAGGNPNILNYASCDYSIPALRQARTFDEAERQQFVDESQSVMSHDAVLVPTTPEDAPGAYRTDTVQIDELGPGGVHELNPWVLINAEPIGDDDMIVVAVDGLVVELRLSHHSPSPRPIISWNTLIYSSLFEYDEHYEMQNVLAEDWSADETDEGVVVTVNLREATFNNGDPITAEDVVFTFQYAYEGAVEGHFPQGLTPPYQMNDEGQPRIEAVDDHTVEFHLEEPFPPLVTKEMAFWGIAPKDRWEEQGAWDNLADFAPEHDVTSGPFEILSWSVGDSLHLGPADLDHPVHNPDHELFLQGVPSLDVAGESLKAGEIDIASELPMGVLEDLEEDYADVTEGAIRRGFLPFALYNQFPHAPTKFLEFRQAIAKVINRQLINGIAMRGFSTEWMDTGMFGEEHPWRPDDEHLWFPTDDPEGDVDDARATLEDAGWSWDSDGNLRYPIDADLDPRWPTGGNPDPDDFDCLDEDGQVILG